MGQSFGNVKIDEVVPEDVYDGHIVDVVNRSTEFGDRAMWVFVLEDENDTEVVGFSSWSMSSQSKLVEWASKAFGFKNVKELKESGKGTDDLSGLPVRLDVEVVEKDGVEKNKVEKLKAPGRGAKPRDVSLFRDELLARLAESDANKSSGGGNSAQARVDRANRAREEATDAEIDDIPFGN